ncbi:hypothetical protein OC835_006040 [Tilletia horrida]|nr:hypothetical protein OC835_006040 [Tilletia horrida]
MTSLASVPDLPAFATASLRDFSEFIETFVNHRLPSAFLGFLIFYTVLHAVLFCLCLPISAKQLHSGRFWLVRLVPCKRGQVIVLNHLDAPAVLIGAYSLYDTGFAIKLLLTYYNHSSQHNIPALFCLRFIILTTIGWIFLLGFFLVRVPPATFTIPAFIWNIGILAIPLGVHFGALFLLIRATNHWNSYWSLYTELRPSIDRALADGAELPSTEQIDTARQMLGVELAGYSRLIRTWAIPYYVWTALFATAILYVTLSILVTHWGDVSANDDMPMQTGRTRTFYKSTGTARSGTASAGIRRWIKNVPADYEQQIKSSTSLGTTAFGEEAAQEAEGTIKAGRRSSEGSPKLRKLLLYGLGLRPLAKDAYNDPAGGFSERRARANLRSLLIHTAIQGSSIFLIAAAQVAAVLLVTQPSFLQPLRTGQVPGWGVKWIRFAGIVKLMECYGTFLPGFLLIGSILLRQMKAIELAKARANEGLRPHDEGRTLTMGPHELNLSAPGPSASARWSNGASTQVYPTTPHSSAWVVEKRAADQIQAQPLTDGERDGDVGPDDKLGVFANIAAATTTLPAQPQPYAQAQLPSEVVAAQNRTRPSYDQTAVGDSSSGFTPLYISTVDRSRRRLLDLEDDSVVDDGR